MFHIVQRVVASIILMALVIPVNGHAKETNQPVVVTSKFSFDETTANLKKVIKDKGLALVFEANHQNMMKMVGITAPKSLTIGFAKPQMAAMLLKIEPLAAMEMPMRIAVRDVGGVIKVIYYKPSYLFAHYDKEKLTKIAKEKLDTMMGALVKQVAKDPLPAVPATAVAKDAGQPVVLASNHSFDETTARLKKVIKDKGLALVFEANHQNMMKMVGITAPKSLTIGFAKPQMAAKLLKIEPLAALEMPMRIAVRDVGGAIKVIYYKPSYLLAHYGKEKLTKIAKAKLDTMVQMFAKKASE